MTLELNWDEGEAWLQVEDPAWEDVLRAVMQANGEVTSLVGLVNLTTSEAVALLGGHGLRVVVEAQTRGGQWRLMDPDQPPGQFLLNSGGEMRSFARREAVHVKTGIRALRYFYEQGFYKQGGLDPALPWEPIHEEET